MGRERAGGGSGPTSLKRDPGHGAGPGTLFLIATPIGNLEDITLRALRVLQEVDWIAAEDTRRTAILLRRHGIDCRLFSHHAHSEHRSAPGLVSRLMAGESGALVTDAGTPAISDPGFHLARAARRAGIRVEVIPGPSAILAALLASGLPADRFAFWGYPPPREGARRRFIESAMSQGCTIVVFEAPHRVLRCMEAIAAIDPEREVAICREMTKKFEQIDRGAARDLLERAGRGPQRGEFTLVIAAGRTKGGTTAADADAGSGGDAGSSTPDAERRR